MTPPPDTRERLDRRFLVVWGGQSLSTIGTYVSAFGAAIYVVADTGSVIWLGVLSAAVGFAALVAAPALGRIDRYERRSVMIGADVIAAVGALAGLVLALTDRLEVWHLVAIGVVGGIGNAIQFPATAAALPLLAGGALDRANGLIQLAPSVAVVIGPALGAALVGWSGIAAVFWLDLATFAIAIAATMSVRFRTPSDEREGTDHDRRGWAPAIAWLRDAGRPFAVLLALMALVNLLLGWFNVAMLVLATDLGGVTRAGLVPAAGGLGMVGVSLYVGARGLPARRVPVIAGGLGMFAAGLAIAALRPSFVLVLTGVALALACVPIVNAAVSTAFNERVPQELQGRVFGLRAVFSQALNPVGSLTAGLVIALVAAPAIDDGGILAGSVGAVIGTGEQRGSALLLAFVAVGLGILAVAVARSRRLAAIDGPDGSSAAPAGEPTGVTSG